MPSLTPTLNARPQKPRQNQISELWERMKKRRTQLKPDLKEALAAVEADRKAKAKTARQNSGLWWGNYNAVRASFDTARSEALKSGATLQFHRFTGEGRFVNQIQHETGTEPVSLATLQGGRFQQVRIGPIDHWKRAELKATVHTGKDSEGRKLRRVLTFSMLMQRELPPGAQIKEVAVVCRKRGGTQHYLPPGEQPHGRHRPRRSAPRVGDEYEWSVTFTCQTPDAATASASRSACGLNLGWRQTPQGLLIATLADSAGRLERTHLPGSILAGLDRAEALQGSLDTAANAMRARLAVWAREAGEDAPEAWREAAAAARRSESHEPLARLALAWKDWDYRPDWRGDGFRLDYRDAAATLESAQTLEAWRKADKLLRQEMEGARRRALNERRKFYEGLAGRLARDHAVIGLGQLDLKRAALRVVADVEENTLAESARRNRQRAGLYELTDWLKKQAAKHGSQVMTAERPVNTTCHATGQRFAPPKDAINYACPACGSHHDRDENAARVALADAAGAPRAVPDAPKPPRRSRFKRLDPEKEIGGTGSAVDSRGAA